MCPLQEPCCLLYFRNGGLGQYHFAAVLGPARYDMARRGSTGSVLIARVCMPWAECSCIGAGVLDVPTWRLDASCRWLLSQSILLWPRFGVQGERYWTSNGGWVVAWPPGITGYPKRGTCVERASPCCVRLIHDHPPTNTAALSSSASLASLIHLSVQDAPKLQGRRKKIAKWDQRGRRRTHCARRGTKRQPDPWDRQGLDSREQGEVDGG